MSNINSVLGHARKGLNAFVTGAFQTFPVDFSFNCLHTTVVLPIVKTRVGIGRQLQLFDGMALMKIFVVIFIQTVFQLYVHG